ncbi:MAG TPA: alpha-L-fucosidase, partial [Fimbriimonadaceae bacterium]|nr:alpha-L-fucosidase [Fimbriimonadaceae bacterium]
HQTSGLKRETKAQKDKRMKWWREARLGMFIHWGLYSIPAGTWDGKTNYAEWIREEAHIPVGEYEKLKYQFNPVKFNADAWVKMARDAGMKYIVITTKHHDGFNLFDSPLTDWNVGHTPFKRDIMAEMARACKKYGIKMCWYHSIMDWHHPDYLPRRSWEAATRPADGANFRKFVKYLRDEVSWLLTHYGPIGVMWFDGEWESTWNAKDGDALYALCRKLQPNVIVNNRVTVGRAGVEDANSMQAGDFTTPEQYIPPTGLGDVDWETCMTMNDHWGYNSHDKNWKSSKTLIQNIVDIASKGGNYLLNIGPRSDGTFPPEAVQRLHDIGKWMDVNGDAIYATKASVFEKLPWGRSTTKAMGNRTMLYLQVFDWPKDGRLVVPGIGNTPIYAHFMGRRQMQKVGRVGPDLVIQVPAKAPNSICTVVALEVAGKPIIYNAPKISTPSTMLVDGTVARIDSGSKELQVRWTADGSEPTARNGRVYNGPIPVERTMTLKAASFHHEKRVSAVTSMRFDKVEPNPAVEAGSEEGLLCEEYKGSWDQVPDFDSLTARTSRTAEAVTVGASKEEEWGMRFSGTISAPKNGVYTFALGSDDGSKLWIDGKVVVDNDGLHSGQTKLGQVALAKGAHKIVIGWFNKSGGLDLSLRWGPIGGKLRKAQGTELRH